MTEYARAAYWRKLPLSIFPALLGFAGLALVFQNAAKVLGVPFWIGEILAGMSVGLSAFFLLSYVVKLSARPSVFWEDLNSPPARAGFAAIPMNLMIMAAILKDLTQFAGSIWIAGLALQFLAALLVIISIRRVGGAQNGMSTFLLLPFVGFIVAPVAGVKLGYPLVSEVVAWGSLIPFAYVLVCNVRRLVNVRPPQPQRMSLVIPLAPISLYAIAFAQFGYHSPFLIIAGIAILTFLTLIFLVRWLISGGWTPIWASLTFPLAAFTNMLFLLVQDRGTSFWAIAAWGMVALATVAILYAVYKSLRAWMRGDLSRISFAAIA